MGQINLGKVKGDRGIDGAPGADGKSVWVKYNSSPKDNGASDIWQQGMNYIGVLTAAGAAKPETGYIWSLFIPDAAIPVNNLTSTLTSLPLSANQGRELKNLIDSKQNKIEFVYTCNGINDNEILSQMSKDFYNSTVLDDNASMNIIINGMVGITAEPIAGTGSVNNRYKFFDFGITNYTGKRKLYTDWGNATFPLKTYKLPLSLTEAAITLFNNNGSFIHYEKLNAAIEYCYENYSYDISTSTHAYGSFGSNCTISNSTLICTCNIIGMSNKNATVYCCAISNSIITNSTLIGNAFSTSQDDTSGFAKANAYGNSGSFCIISNSTLTGNAYAKAFYGNASADASGNNGQCTISNSTLTGISDANTTSGYIYSDANGNSGINSVITNSTLIGIGSGNSDYGNSYISAYGNNASRVRVINCVLSGLTPTGTYAYGYYSAESSSSEYHLIQNCLFPLGTKSGYNTTPASVTGIYLGSSANIGYVIQGNAIHSAFTTKIAAPATVADKRFQANNLTTISITKSI